MPIYEFRCNECGRDFEQLVFASDGKINFICPSCGSNDTCKLMSSFSCGSSSEVNGLGSSISSGCGSSGGFS
ncbi:MAG: zinc ribbon domain-containing protein [Pseudomonadota bacterium]